MGSDIILRAFSLGISESGAVDVVAFFGLPADIRQ